MFNWKAYHLDCANDNHYTAEIADRYGRRRAARRWRKMVVRHLTQVTLLGG